MKIKIEIELDTDNQEDQIKVEKVLCQLDQIKELLEKFEENLNKNSRRNKQ